MNASPGPTIPLPAAAALYDGETERKLIPACVHYAGSPRLLEKSFALQQQFAGRFDVCCDCEDGAAISNELAHADTLGRRAALQIADGFRVGARIHDPRHGATVHEALSLLTATAGRLAFLTIPKAESHAELTLCLDQLERAAAQLGLALPPVHVLIETHGALRDVFAIAADRRVEAIEFGLMDFVSAHRGAIPTAALESPGQFDHPLVRRAKLEIAAAAHAAGKLASHNVSLALDDPERVAGDARRSAQEFGFQRMWSIHPSQIAPILDAFRPGNDEIAIAVAVLSAAQAANWAPIRHAGRLHDRASYRLFWSLLRRAQADGAELPPAAVPLFGTLPTDNKAGVAPVTTGTRACEEIVASEPRLVREAQPYWRTASSAGPTQACAADSFTSSHATHHHRGPVMSQLTPGAKFRAAVAAEKPLQVVGAINAYHATLAKASGFKAIYLSGGGVAAGSLGLPDLGISTLDDVLTDVRRITDVCDLPLLVDVDTGFGPSAFNIERTVKSLIKFGAGAMHIEDQVGAKRCGHRPGKAIVTQDEMVDRVKAAVDARTDPDFVVMARTDALAVEGLQAAIDRACACVEAGADMIFPEAMTDLAMYKQFAAAVKVPVLANITEFGSTPLYTTDELRQADVSLVLYPLSAFRAMNKAALNVYQAIRRDGTQQNVVDTMQTRAELYEYLGYHDFEQRLDALFAQGKR